MRFYRMLWSVCLATTAAAVFSLRIFAVTETETFPKLSSIYTHYSADNPANGVAESLAHDFGPDLVDVATGTLKLPDLGFGPVTYPKGLGFATPVTFSSTGTLPAPLKPGTAYFIVPAPSGGYQVYAEATDADAALQPGGVPGEKVLRAQNVAQGVGAVRFENAGAGLHRIHSKPLLHRLADWTSNGFDSLAKATNNKHFMLELDRDDAGRPFIRTVGAQVRENWMGSYNGYGPTFWQGPAEKRVEARRMVESKRVVYQVYVCRVRSHHERQVMKFLAAPEAVDSALDRINYATDARMANRFNHGDLVLAKSYGDGQLPTPLKEGVDYYAYKVDAKNLTLHLSAEDAATGANPVDLRDAGKGSFLFWAPQRVGDARRWSFFTEVLAPDSGGNTLSVRLNEPVRNGLLKNASAFTPDGELKGLGGLPDLTPLVFWAPPRAALPAPMQSGMRYWISKASASASSVRLHVSLDEAKAAVGKSTAESSCLQFTSPGIGESLASYDDSAAAVGYGTLMKGLGTFTSRIPLGPLTVFVFKIDFDDPQKNAAYATLGINKAFSDGSLLEDIKKGPTPKAVNESYPAWTLFNSAQGHVPIDMDLYEAVYGSSTEAVADGEIEKLVDYFKNKYDIRGVGP